MFAKITASKLLISSKFTPKSNNKSFLSSVRAKPFYPKRSYCSETKKEEQETTEEFEDNEVGRLKKDLALSQATVLNLKEEILRARAEAENTRKIAQRDVETAKEYGVQSFAKSILDVNDNLKRAIDSVKQYHAEDHPQLHALYEGVVMTKQILVHCLEKQGITEYESLGEQFNPAVHEALFRIPYSEGAVPHTVGAVITTGYKLKSRVLRAAQVGVVDVKPEEPEQQQPEH